MLVVVVIGFRIIIEEPHIIEHDKHEAENDTDDGDSTAYRCDCLKPYADKSQGEAETREGAGCRENCDVFFVHIDTPFG